ncbi:MAG: aminotransferase class V-fold PLP-dependent enzyme, partial [Cytophagales bacterium]
MDTATPTSVYLDNAATTALDPAVLEAMLPFFKDMFGNPSSIHSHGAKVKSAIEKARKKVANCLNAAPAEIFFTSGGTEADNTALRCTVQDKNIKRIITTPIEHHAVLHTVEDLHKTKNVELCFLPLDGKGNPDLAQLEKWLQEGQPTLVSLMHGNNEIGNLLDLNYVAGLCKQHGAVFHSDTVQTIGHFALDTQAVALDFCAGAAHKFHGPKGTG